MSGSVESFLPSQVGWEDILYARSKKITVDTFLEDGLVTDDIRNMASFIFYHYNLIFYSHNKKLMYLDYNTLHSNIIEVAKRLLTSKDGYVAKFAQEYITRKRSHQENSSNTYTLDTRLVEQIASRIGLYKFFPKALVYLTLAVFGNSTKKWVVTPEESAAISKYHTVIFNNHTFDFKITEIDCSEITLNSDIPSIWKYLYLLTRSWKTDNLSTLEVFEGFRRIKDILALHAPAINLGYGTHGAPLANILASMTAYEYVSDTTGSHDRENAYPMFANLILTDQHCNPTIYDHKDASKFFNSVFQNIDNIEFRNTLSTIQDQLSPALRFIIDHYLGVHSKLGKPTMVPTWSVSDYARSQINQVTFGCEAIEDQIKELRGDPTAVLEEDTEEEGDDDTSSEDDEIPEDEDDEAPSDPSDNDFEDDPAQDENPGDGEDQNNSIATTPVGKAFAFIDLQDNEEKASTLYCEAVWKACQLFEARQDLIDITPEGLSLLKDWCARWMWLTPIEDTQRVLKVLGIEDQFKTFSVKEDK
jgi:hypothetical protein